MSAGDALSSRISAVIYAEKSMKMICSRAVARPQMCIHELSTPELVQREMEIKTLDANGCA